MMSSGLPSLRAVEDKTTHCEAAVSGEYGVESAMHTGLASTIKDKTGHPIHPIQYSLDNFEQQKEKMELATARTMQGLHMPMKLGMERFAAKQVGRLPCMATRTSNLLEDTLTGRAETIDVSDVLNDPMEFPELAGDSHASMERRLGLL